MNQVDLKNEDPIQLKQTIIHLRAELNKYQTKESKATSDLMHTLQTENHRLKEEHMQLLYAHKKSEKQLRIYEKRIATLQTQKDKLVILNDQLQSTEREFQSGIQKLMEVVGTMGEINSEKSWTQTLDMLHRKIDKLTFYQADPQKNDDLIGLLADKKKELLELKTELDAEKSINRTQSELIEILESYVERLVKEPGELKNESILQQIITLTEGYANKYDYPD